MWATQTGNVSDYLPLRGFTFHNHDQKCQNQFGFAVLFLLI